MKKLMKKNVPFMMRGYLLAYLYVTRTEKPGKPKSAEKSENKPQQTRQTFETATAFYINIGKISKCSVHEMTDFICEKANLQSEDIVNVVFKQNYSFVYIVNNKIDGIIEAVTGQTFKGKKVKMNYSKDKDEQ